MSTPYRELARRWFEEVWNQRKDSTIEEILSPHAHGYMEGGEVRGHAAFKAVRQSLLDAFPDMQIEVEDIAEDGARVIVRWVVRATHRGDGLGITATGAPVEFRGMTWQEYADGQLVRGWDAWNQGALLESLRTLATQQAQSLLRPAI